MPTPLEILFDPISLWVIGMYAAFIIIETLFPAKKLPAVKGWKVRGLACFVVYFYLSTYLPMFWDQYLTGLQFLIVDWAHPYLVAFAALIVFEFGVYVWHRAMHGNDWLWLPFHQMHHSAERVDNYGTFFYSPLDMIGFTMLGSLSLSVFVGLSPDAITIYLFTSLFVVMFQHANFRTPQWIGYFIQRPESHSIHHQKGVHAFNYSDFPIFDMLFGTFKNPKNFIEDNGFYHGASAKIPAMLLWQDLNKEN